MKLIELFPEISLNPSSAKDIKQWILQLAVEGKLTKKWREENPTMDSSVLLKKINIEKTELLKAKKIKKETFEPLNQDDFIAVPKKWIWQRLGEIGFIFNGDSINATVKEQRYTNIEDGFPYVSTKDVGYGFEDIDLHNGVKIPKDEPKFKIARKNTILICAEGGSAGKKMGILTEESCFGNKLFAIHEYSGILPRYILIFYGSLFFQDEFQSRMSGIIGGISRNKFAEIPICLPPLEEQQAIVSIVEELFKEVDALAQKATERIALKRSYAQAALQRLCEADTAKEWQQIVSVFPEIFNDKQTIKTLRETILQLAVQGKLTAKWRSSRASLPTYQTAHELLALIKAEKAQLIKDKKIKAEKPLPPIEADEIPFELPEGWVWCRLGEVVSILGDGIHGTPNYDSLGEYYFINGNNLSDGKIEIKESTKRISEKEYLKYRKELNERSVLVSINGTIGNTAFYNGENVMLGKSACYFNLFSSIDKEFIRQVIKSKYFLDYAFESATGTTIQNVSLKTMREFLISLPNLSEQQIIVEKVNALMGLCDELEREVEAKENILQKI